MKKSLLEYEDLFMSMCKLFINFYLVTSQYSEHLGSR